MPIKASKQRGFIFTVIFCVIVCVFIFRQNEHQLSFPTSHIRKVRFFKSKYSRQKNPSCDNILTNLTKGQWVLTSPEKEAFHDDVLLGFWRKRGIQKKQWRDDQQCGYYRSQPKMANSSWPTVGSWCDPDGDMPCCSNKWSGLCRPANASVCACKECVDLRDYHHAESSRWKTADKRCSWTNYTGLSACNVIEKSPFSDIYFVGDSFMRNMFLTMLILLSDDPMRGAWNKTMTAKAKDLCTLGQLYFWKECRHILTSMNQVHNTQTLCGGREPKFNVTMKPFYNINFKNDFLNLVESLLGKEGSLIIIGVGFHLQCSADITITNFFKPAMSLIEKYYEQNNPIARWPQIYFVTPMPLGLLKPPVHFSLQNDQKIDELTATMQTYCKLNRIPLIDFRPLGKLVHSFDGTHFGQGVNVMKIQILLNYIASLDH